ncbi:MAG: hypothetical protein OEY14_02850 [Myxococcales bacterium]|nr:hypothetical protein [Myxococcales bacterium]
MITLKLRGAEALGLLNGNPQLLAQTQMMAAQGGAEFEMTRSGMVKGMAGKGAAGQGVAIKGEGARLALAKGMTARAGELEGARITATAKGAVIQAAEMESARLAPAAKGVMAHGLMGPGVGGVAVGPGAAAAGAGAHGVGAAAGAKTVGAGAVAAKGVGAGLGLGTMGPVLAVAAIGLVAAGVYLYLRNAAYEDDEFLEDEGAFTAATS